MWSDPRYARPPYHAPPPSPARPPRDPEGSWLCWWIAGLSFALAVVGGIVFLSVRPSASDEVLCALGSVTACDNWRQDRVVHFAAAYGGLAALGIAVAATVIGAILALAGE